MRVSRHILTVGLSLVSPIGACGAMAEPLPVPSVHMIEAYGSGCKAPNSVVGTVVAPVASGSVVDLAYDMIFTEMSAFTAPPEQTEGSTDCHVGLEVTPPRGYRFAITSLLAAGSYEAPRNETEAQLFGGYKYSSTYEDQQGRTYGDTRDAAAFESTPMGFALSLNKSWESDNSSGYRLERSVGIGADRGNFDILLRPDHITEAPCNARVYVSGDLGLSASSFAGAAAEVNLQRTVANGKAHLGWGWQLRRCDDGQEPSPPSGPECTSVLSATWLGSWHSAYSVANPNGGGVPNVVAELSIGRDGTGYYRTHLFTGHLSNITQCGRVLRGQWLVGSDFGAFQFVLNHDEQSFRGSYTHERGGFAGNVQIGAGVWEGRR